MPHCGFCVNCIFSPYIVPSGGEDSPKAAAGVCGVHRVERHPAHKGCECGGCQKR